MGGVGGDQAAAEADAVAARKQKGFSKMKWGGISTQGFSRKTKGEP
jgi:hypothetical protein